MKTLSKLFGLLAALIISAGVATADVGEKPAAFIYNGRNVHIGNGNLKVDGYIRTNERLYAKQFNPEVGTLAAAGTGVVGDAAQITKSVTYVTATDDTKAVKLAATPTIGDVYKVINTVASKNLAIFPLPTGAAINGGSANASVTLYGKKALSCTYVAANDWRCDAEIVPGTRTLFIPAGIGRINGHTGGAIDWVNTGTAINEATLANSGTGCSFTIPVTGLRLGETIESYKVIAQIENTAGNAGVTLDADLRKLVNAAGDPVDSSLGAITQVVAAADTAVASSKTLATAELIDSGDLVYALITGSTGAASDMRLLGIEVVVRSEY